jgi:SAM-dependent methyltransferase
MWMNYEQNYQEAVKDPSFLLWRKKGARYKADNILAVCKGLPIESIIEIGCGTGAVLRELMNRGFARAYSGTDISAAALTAARKELGIQYHGGFVADAGYLPVPGRSFSVAILSHVLEHLNQPLRAAQEASRIAEFVVAEVPTEKVLTNWIRRNLLGRAYSSIEEAGHVQFWSPRSFVQFLRRDCGFEILALQRAKISKEEDLFGKKGMEKLKPMAKHALQSILPSLVLSWIFTTHTTVLCRRLAGSTTAWKQKSFLPEGNPKRSESRPSLA